MRHRRDAASHRSTAASPSHVRGEIAAAAARLIADEGLTDYAAAKRKAASSLGFGHNVALPDNHEIDAALREHLALFQADSQPLALTTLRATAYEVMQNLADFSPKLVGAVLTGVANEFSPIELEIVTDDSKALDIFFLNANIPYDVALRGHGKGRGGDDLPTYLFAYRDAEVRVYVYVSESQRAQRAPKQHEGRANIGAVAALINGAKTAPA